MDRKNRVDTIGSNRKVILKTSITKDYSFSAAHKLDFHEGLCKNLHGHNYKVEVTVTGKIQTGEQSSSGMVLDFYELDQLVDPIIKTLDHTVLNESLRTYPEGIDYVYPTAELLAATIFEILTTENQILEAKMSNPNPIEITRITVWETDKARATVEA